MKIVGFSEICGKNGTFPAERVGCGKEIATCAEVYRCTDCQVPFHRECAVRHFGRAHPKVCKPDEGCKQTGILPVEVGIRMEASYCSCVCGQAVRRRDGR